MTRTRSALHTALHAAVAERPGERGSALLAVLLLLMMMSALVAALSVNGRVETAISRNQRSATQAQVAAEAGLNHAVELATTFVFQWKTNGFADADAAIAALLLGPDGAIGTVAADADNGSLGTRTGIGVTEELPIDTRLAITGGIDAEYEAFLLDDDADAPDEDGDPYTDANRTLILRATGYAEDDTKVVLEAVIAPLELGAVVVNGDLDISGNVTIDGTEGSVHANGDLDITGGSASITGDITASETYTGSLAGTGSSPELPLPEIRASDYLAFADFILTSTGTMTDPVGTVLCTAAAMTSCNSWNFNAGVWSISTTATSGTYYVEGGVAVTGSPGTEGSPIQLTIIAEGSIDISGSPDFAADTPELLFVTDGDLEISGGLDSGNPLTFSGQMLVHEQVKISGNPALGGQLIVENAPSVDTLVTQNDISGNPTITYNGGLGTGTLSVQGWRDVRQ
jgi:cytoskeletal protein CcmA (bactofilin family)